MKKNEQPHSGQEVLCDVQIILDRSVALLRAHNAKIEDENRRMIETRSVVDCELRVRNLINGAEEVDHA